MNKRESMAYVFRRYFFAALAVVLVLVLVYTVYQLRHVAFIIAVSGLLAYFLAWPVERLSKKLKRTAAVWIVFSAFFIVLLALFGSIVPVVSIQIQQLISTVPEMLQRLEESTRELSWQVLPGREFVVSDYYAGLMDEVEARIPDILGNVFDFTQSLLTGTATVIAALLIIPLLTLYMLLDSQRLRMALIGCFPTRVQADVADALAAVNRSLGSYIYSRVLLALFVGTTSTLVLLVLGVDYALLLGLLAFAGEFIPVLGPWLAFAPTALIVLATDPYKLVAVAVLYLAIQLFENYWLAPRWMGNTMDLHPLTIVLAMMIGGTLGGIAGLFVAVPVAAALKVIMGVFVFRRKEQGIEIPVLATIQPDTQENNTVSRE